MRWTVTGLRALAALGAVGLLTGLVAVAIVPGEYGYVEGPVNVMVSVLPFFALSLYLFVRRPDHAVARLLMVTASLLCLFTGLSGELSLVGRTGRPVPLLWLQTLSLQWAASGFGAGLAATFIAFPDPRIDDPLRKWTLRALACTWALMPLLSLLTRPSLGLERALMRPRPSGLSPLFVRSLAWLDAVPRLWLHGSDWIFVLGIVGLLIRRERPTTPTERIQLRWMTAAGVLFGLFVTAMSAATKIGILSPALYAAAPCLIFFPVAITISVLRHQLLDVEVVLRRSMLYGALSILIAFAYAGLAASLGITAGGRLPVGAAIAVTVVLMLAFQPLRHRLERAADHWVFGERISGYQLLTRFGANLAHAYDLSELAPSLAAATVDGLQVRWAHVDISLTTGGDPILERLGEAGEATAQDADVGASIPLVHAGEMVGLLTCGPKADGPLTADDLELLATLGRQAALAVHNSRLAAELAGRIDEIHRQAGELAASRTRIVLAQDLERRRIERDIHDGAQQEIVAMLAKLRLARNQLARADERTDATLAELQDDARLALSDLRELAHGIHPPILTDRGLFEALDARASRAELPVEVHADPWLRSARFPADVEGAAFFFASEALANALKHAEAHRVDVRLSLQEGALVVDVEDDGVGFVPADRPGQGLANMRDRVEALGGHFRMAGSPGGGTRVRAELPTSLEAGNAARSDR